jgi:hypothetical protein
MYGNCIASVDCCTGNENLVYRYCYAGVRFYCLYGMYLLLSLPDLALLLPTNYQQEKLLTLFPYDNN